MMFATRRSLAQAAALLLLSLTSVACKEKTAPAPAGSATPKQFVIGMSQCNLGEPWRVQMNADIDRAAKQHPNLKVVFKDAQNDSLRQRAQVEELLAQQHQTAEGVKSCRSILDLARKHDVDMPITEQVVAVVHEGRTPGEMLRSFMSRDAKSE